jgi:hypothetical protein
MAERLETGGLAGSPDAAAAQPAVGLPSLRSLAATIEATLLRLSLAARAGNR